MSMVAPLDPHKPTQEAGFNMKKFIENIAKKAHLILIPEWRAVQLDEERHLGRLLNHLGIDCVFDVGANVGQFGQMLRRYVGYTGRIISFEPNPTAFQPLQKAASGDPLWHVENFALGASSGMAEFHAYESSLLGSFHAFSDSTHAPDSMASSHLQIPVQTLEDFLPRARQTYGFSRPYLKLDTQGFDLEVAKGAGGRMAEFLGVQTEVAFQNIYENAPSFGESLAFFQSRGFVLSRLVPIHDIHFPDLVEMDAMFVRNDFAK
jgi:FkbM family methyltransferase